MTKNNAQLEENLKKESAERDRHYAELDTQLKELSSLNQNLEKEKKQLNDQIEDLRNKFYVSETAHETEISHKDQEIAELKEHLRIAQSPRIAEHSEVLSFCLEQYDIFWETQPAYRRLPLFDQRDEMSEIVTRLFDRYLIIKH